MTAHDRHSYSPNSAGNAPTTSTPRCTSGGRVTRANQPQPNTTVQRLILALYAMGDLCDGSRS